MKILVLHGPNLSKLGVRSPEIYGRDSLASINEALQRTASELGVAVEAFQSNHEGELVDRILDARDAGFAGIVINPAAYSHTSVAILDALDAVKLPAVEVHLSNIHGREEFRHRSLTAAACTGVFAGFGAATYLWGLRALVHRIEQTQNQ